MGFEVERLQRRKVLLPWSYLGLPVKGNSLVIAKSIDDRDRSTIVAAGVVADIDDDTFQLIEVMTDRIKRTSQSFILNAFQLEDPNVAKFRGPGVVKHPRLSLFW